MNMSLIERIRGREEKGEAIEIRNLKLNSILKKRILN
ncbi:MAG: hypothetical protein ACJAT2_002577 [Bacteriovoracaceae bacterium]|jgi:hypothetical protein